MNFKDMLGPFGEDKKGSGMLGSVLPGLGAGGQSMGGPMGGIQTASPFSAVHNMANLADQAQNPLGGMKPPGLSDGGMGDIDPVTGQRKPKPGSGMMGSGMGGMY